MEDNTIKDLVSDMLSSIVLGDKPEEEQVTSTGLMSSLPGVRTPTQTQQQEQEAAPKARDKVKEFILRLSDEAEDTNSLRYSEKAAPEITDVMVDSETLLNRYATPLYVYARNLRDYNPERSTIKVRNRGDHSERFLDQMYELARQSSEEAALARMEMGITESLPRSAPRMGFDVQGLIDAVNRENALRAGTKPLPSIPEVETEELDDEEVAILSDTDIDTDDADGGAAPSDGKGLMSPLAPSESLRPKARPSLKTESLEPLFSFIEKGEGGYEASNRGTKGNKIIGSDLTTKRNGKLLTEMTISEIREKQKIKDPDNEERLFAVGRFQLIPSTFNMAVEALGLSDDTVFNEDTQNRIGIYLIADKRAKVGQYLEDKGNVSLETAMLELAKEFASMPVPKDMTVTRNGKKVTIKKGDSYYGSGNKALHTYDEVKEELEKLRGTI